MEGGGFFLFLFIFWLNDFYLTIDYANLKSKYKFIYKKNVIHKKQWNSKYTIILKIYHSIPLLKILSNIK